MAKSDGHGWVAKARKKNPAEPGWRGELKIAGRVFAVSGWVKTDRFGKPFLAVAPTETDKEGRLRPKGSVSDTGGQGRASGD